MSHTDPEIRRTRASQPFASTTMTWAIRRLASSDLEELNDGLPAWWSGEYGRRLEAQERGELAMVVAWDDGVPVGRAMILFPEHEEYSESAAREGCAEIRDVAVVREHRRRGIATELLRALEAVALGRGSARAGLSVSVDEEPARRLYDGLGYRYAHGPYLTSVRLDTDDGAGLCVGGDVIVT